MGNPEPRVRRRRSRGWSLIEVMVSSSVLVIGLLAVTGATTSAALLRKRAVEQHAIFAGIEGRLEWARSQLFVDTAFHDAAQASLAGGAAYVASFVLDQDGDGAQDFSFAPGDRETPVLRVTVTAPEPPGDPTQLLNVRVDATWYGVGGSRTANLEAFVANRTGFGS